MGPAALPRWPLALASRSCFSLLLLALASRSCFSLLLLALASRSCFSLLLLALASRWSRAWGSPRCAPDNAAKVKLRFSSAALHFPSFLVRSAAPAARTHRPARPAPGVASSTAATEEAGRPPLPRPGAEYISRVDRLPHAPGAVLLSRLPATGSPPAPQRPRALRDRHAAPRSASVPARRTPAPRRARNGTRRQPSLAASEVRLAFSEATATWRARRLKYGRDGVG
jgi:hypothetical protein